MEAGAGRGRGIATRDWRVNLDDFAHATSLGADLPRLEGRSVVLAVGDMAKAAAALIELDGLARRIVLCPPGFDARGLDALIREAEADALVYDGDAVSPPVRLDVLAPCRLPLEPLASPRSPSPRSRGEGWGEGPGGLHNIAAHPAPHPNLLPASGEKGPVRRLATEWVMPTSGTSGPPKMVVHTLATLTGAFRPAPAQAWATFYDIRRYGGLQIFLRALSGDGVADAERRRREPRGVPSPLGRSGRETYFRHAVALAQGADERAGAPHRARRPCVSPARSPTIPCSPPCARSIRKRASNTPTPRPKRASLSPSATAGRDFPRR